MTRRTFDCLFLEQYDDLVHYARRKAGPSNGMDCVHQAYANIIEHETYKKKVALASGVPRAKWWIFLKVAREVVRMRAKERLRRVKEWESGHDTSLTG